MRYLIIIERGDTGYGGSVPDVPGVFAARDSPQEVERLVGEALAEHLAILREDGEPVPTSTYTHAYVDVDVDVEATD
jgi:predicted RNase H-like HicB family nuclease